MKSFPITEQYSMYKNVRQVGGEGRCIIARVGMQGGGRGWSGRPTSRRPARRLLSPLRLIFITRISLVVFFLFPAHREPGDAHKENRIIRLYELTNAIDFYNEATKPSGDGRRLCL